MRGRSALLLLIPSVAHAQVADRAQEVTTRATAPPAASSAGGQGARALVHFMTAERGVTIYSRPVRAERPSGAAPLGEPRELRALCEAPCAAALETALHELALAPPGGEPILAATALEIRADAHVQGHIISHAAERTTGWWLLGLTGGVGVTSTTLGMLQTCGSDQTCQEWTSLAIWSGIAVTTAGALLAIPKIATSDEVILTVVPGTAPLRDLGRSDRLGTEPTSAVLGGATLAGCF